MSGSIRSVQPRSRNTSQPLSWIAPRTSTPTPSSMRRYHAPQPPSRERAPHRSPVHPCWEVATGHRLARRHSSALGRTIGRRRPSRSTTFRPNSPMPWLLGATEAAAGVEGDRPPSMARGGGVDAFKKGEARIPENREDDDNPAARPKSWFDRADTGARWTRFKWVLFISNLLYTVFAILSLVTCLLIWLDIFAQSDVIRVANQTELIFTTLAASVAVFTAIFGWAGVVLNNRSFLAVYTFFLWLAFALLLVPGYLTYRRQALNLLGKLNFQWSEDFDVDARRRVQNALGCCGYFSPFVEASVSAACYARSVLPGCKGGYFRFERALLRRWYVAVFALAGYTVLAIAAALLCANHVTYRFGKGMMPKAYRLNAESVALIMDNYAAQLAEQYGPDVASAAIAHTRSLSNLNLDFGTMTPMPYSSARETSDSSRKQQYGTVEDTAADTAI
ncbi:hypothetical protein B0H10DRAFT_2046145 [Mycena sp. CBHHK59/15]|nr:hypothetical protein B0H10DRAFT_2046145 [Mycena sp. CBHHK59/15]